MTVMKPDRNLPAMTRRQFGLSAIAAAAAGAFMPRSVFAADQLVVANWGGDAVTAFEQAFAEPWGKLNSGKLVVDGGGPSEGAIKTQVDSGAVRWDVCDGEMYSSYRLGKEDLVEKLDFNVIDKNLVGFGDVHDFGIANYVYSYVIAFDAAKFGGDPPKSWADFWDVKKYPGKRALYKWMSANLEIALLADGVKPEELYPLDLDRALAKIAELKPHILTHWETGAESQQLLRDGEIVMGQVWNTRAELVKKQTSGQIDYTFDQAVVSPSVWFVPKGNPAGRDAAMRFIRMTQEPEVQAKLMEVYGMGPVNPAANALLSPELQKISPTAPENIERSVSMQNQWYAENYGQALDKYTALISG
ncbi:ABC transporter substrate-binding protein [Shinella granuli]|nr:ABC transporter substrate-binding protein [Shinella granuli]